MMSDHLKHLCQQHNTLLAELGLLTKVISRQDNAHLYTLLS